MTDKIRPVKHTAFSVPAEAVKFILLQRTGLQKFNSKLLRKLGVPYHPHLCHWESRLRRDRIIHEFAQTIFNDYNELAPHLPAGVTSILDIGCGVAGIDVALSQHYASVNPHFYLLDKTTVSPRVFYDFHEEAAYYNSLAAARSTLTSNGVSTSAITCLEADESNRIPIDRPVDLVLSLISWGFHYPVKTYLPEVARILSARGAVILDVRKESSGQQDLRSQFPHMTVISEKPKFVRILARR